MTLNSNDHAARNARLTTEQRQHVNGMNQSIYLLDCLDALGEFDLLDDPKEYAFRTSLVADIQEDLAVLGIDSGDGYEDAVNIARTWLADEFGNANQKAMPPTDAEELAARIEYWEREAATALNAGSFLTSAQLNTMLALYEERDTK